MIALQPGWRPEDLVILGFENEAFELDLPTLRDRFNDPEFNAQLRSLPVTSFARLLAHEALPLGVLHEMELEDRVHTLMHPVLGHVAARAFYRKDSSDGSLPEELAPRRPLRGEFAPRSVAALRKDRLALSRGPRTRIGVGRRCPKACEVEPAVESLTQSAYFEEPIAEVALSRCERKFSGPTRRTTKSTSSPLRIG